MKLIASNLGQILGRLQIEAEPKVVACGAARRQRQVLELVIARGSVRCGDVAQALGISVDNASVLMHLMYRRGALGRLGALRRYTYTLP